MYSCKIPFYFSVNKVKFDVCYPVLLGFTGCTLGIPQFVCIFFESFARIHQWKTVVQALSDFVIAHKNRNVKVMWLFNERFGCSCCGNDFNVDSETKGILKVVISFLICSCYMPELAVEATSELRVLFWWHCEPHITGVLLREVFTPPECQSSTYNIA